MLQRLDAIRGGQMKANVNSQSADLTMQAKLLLGQGRLDAAQQALSQAVKIDRNNFEAYKQLAITLEAQGFIDYAFFAAQNAALLEPRNTAAYLLLGGLPPKMKIGLILITHT